METRSSHRTKFKMTVHCKIADIPGQQVALAGGNRFEVDAFDISKTGLGVFSNVYLPKGVIVELDLKSGAFKLHKEMKLEGEVMYCRSIGANKYKCGFHFKGVNNIHKRAILRFLSMYERRKSPRYPIG